ncbi:Gfo/Idh/MocA family protein [Phytoactinopolyspora limicola]|uniref:Gfo/Idh/MocA family protein n=1 Tax=Phytoactinopolyspora limicola TaxID=2715536 RepID=UPI001FE4F0F0|nr:Gfo/Idh/MocA family oxidoreductase [Phytoactinopolyspora limicola]
MVDTPEVRVAVVGLGLIAQAVHLHNLHTLRDRFAVTHACDASPRLAEQVAAEWGIPRHSTDVAAVLADSDVDAVLLLTPGTHAQLARRALDAGKHVLAEKPFAHTVAECVELDRLAQQRDRVLQIAYMKMYYPVLARARQALDRIGDVRLVRVTVLHPDHDGQFAHQRKLSYADVDASTVAAARAYESDRLDEALGALGEPFRSIYRDVLQGSVCHEMSLLRAIFGELPVQFGHAQVGAADPGEQLADPPQIQALGRLGPAQLLLSWNWLPGYAEYTEEVAVFGSAGRIRVSMPGPYLRDHRAEVVVERMDAGEPITERYVAEHRTGFVHELLAFHASVVEGAPVLSTAAGAAYDTSALQGVAAALAAGYGVEIGGEAGSRGRVWQAS